MSAFNILVLALGLIAIVLGLRRGLIAQAGQIIALVVAIMACRMFGPKVEEWFGATAPSATVDTAISYALTFLVAYFAVVVVAHLVRGVVHGVHLGVLDRLAGAVFKLGVWMLILSVVLNVWAALPGESDITDTRQHPERAYILRIAPAVCGYVMERAAENSHYK